MAPIRIARRQGDDGDASTDRSLGGAARLVAAPSGDPTIKLPVKVVPGASRDGIAGWLGDTLKVRVSAPPEGGKANAAVEALLAGALGVASDGVRVVRGRTSPRKVVEIVGLSESDVRSRLEGSA